MVPLILHIKNFLSYGPFLQSISFENHHLICLSGNNGNGKSALLEAITWSLWGYARRIHGVTKDDQSLVRMGEKDMYVGLEFLVNQVRYVVRRSYVLSGKKNHSELVFGICTSDGIITKSLTENTQRDTQEKINQILGVDYETFTNSVFLKQGQSNEFSKKNPKDRKEILGKILGINELERVRKLILEDVRALQESAKIHEKQLEIVQGQCISSDELNNWHKRLLEERSQYISKKESYVLLKNEENEQKNNKAKLMYERQDIINTLSKKELQKKELRTKIIQDADFYRNAKSWYRIIQHEYSLQSDTINECIVLLVQKKDELESFILEANKAQKELYQRKLTVHERYEDQIRSISELLWKEKSNFVSLQEKISFLKKQQIAFNDFLVKNDESILQLKRELSVVKNDEEVYFSLEVRCIYLNKKIKLLQIKSNVLHALYGTTNQSYELLVSAASEKCPTCSSELHEETKKNILFDLTIQRERIKKLIDQRRKRTEIITKQLKMLEEQCSLKRYVFTKKKEILFLSQQKEESHIRSQKELHDGMDELAIVESAFNACAMSIDSREISIQSLRKEQSEAHFFDDHYQKLEKQIVLYEVYQKKYSLLEKHLATMQAFKNVSQSYCFKESKKNIKAMIAELRLIGDIASSDHIKTIDDHIKNAEEKIQFISLQCEQMHEELLAFHQSLAQDHAQYKAREEKQQEISDSINYHKTHYALAVESFTQKNEFCGILSRDGLQAALIEQVIPTIELEANDLLDRLSDGQARITIESIRDLKSGKPKETLDIIISDALGTRPYEFFSGGEAFRIDLALRIALAKTLAKRSGSSLQTLIIDEGFGSQDAGGIEAIVQALQKIKEDFQKIIIVSHLSSFKDHFSTHFIVHKTPQGSVVKVFQQE